VVSLWNLFLNDHNFCRRNLNNPCTNAIKWKLYVIILNYFNVLHGCNSHTYYLKCAIATSTKIVWKYILSKVHGCIHHSVNQWYLCVWSAVAMFSDVHCQITGISSAPTQVTCVVLTSSMTCSVAKNRTPPYVEVIDQLLRAGWVNSNQIIYLNQTTRSII